MLPGIDLVELVTAVGYVGPIAIVFAESGPVVDTFPPGDSHGVAAIRLDSDSGNAPTPESTRLDGGRHGHGPGVSDPGP